MKKLAFSLVAAMPILASATGWTVTPNPKVATELDYFYTNASAVTSQYAALDETSGYFRLIYGPTAGWGTSIDLMPSFWSGGALYQGYPVSVKTTNSGTTVTSKITGTEKGLTTTVSLTLDAPATADIVGFVSATTTGTVTLDTNRPHEAFKPVFLSSMHDSSTVWDSQYPIVVPPYPASGWIFGPTNGMFSTKWGLQGGTSTWKKNAPTIELIWPAAVEVAGWLNADTNPNDDNVGLWAATATIPTSWSYEILCTS